MKDMPSFDILLVLIKQNRLIDDQWFTKLLKLREILVRIARIVLHSLGIARVVTWLVFHATRKICHILFDWSFIPCRKYFTEHIYCIQKIFHIFILRRTEGYFPHTAAANNMGVGVGVGVVGRLNTLVAAPQLLVHSFLSVPIKRIHASVE